MCMYLYAFLYSNSEMLSSEFLATEMPCKENESDLCEAWTKEIQQHF